MGHVEAGGWAGVQSVGCQLWPVPVRRASLGLQISEQETLQSSYSICGETGAQIKEA